MTKSSEDTIHFCITGGTIDSYFDGIKDTVVCRSTSIIPRYIEAFKMRQKTIFSDICMKDSREVSDTDREKLVGVLEESSSTKVIITHGTYTMSDTARFLKKHLKRQDQTIILTGSMIPLGGVSPSDGGFNLGYALAQTSILPAGVYVCMNGKVFDADNVTKIVDQGIFDVQNIVRIV